MRLHLAHRLMLHGGAVTRGRGILSPADALPLCADALRAADAEVRQAAAELLVRAHAISPPEVEAWLASQPSFTSDLLELLDAHLAAARTRLLRPSYDRRAAAERELGMTGGALGASLSELPSRPTTAVTLGNLLQRPPTAMNGGAGLSLPPGMGGVRATLERAGLVESDEEPRRPSAGAGAVGEEPQILRLE